MGCWSSRGLFPALSLLFIHLCGETLCASASKALCPRTQHIFPGQIPNLDLRRAALGNIGPRSWQYLQNRTVSGRTGYVSKQLLGPEFAKSLLRSLYTSNFYVTNIFGRVDGTANV